MRINFKKKNLLTSDRWQSVSSYGQEVMGVRGKKKGRREGEKECVGVLMTHLWIVPSAPPRHPAAPSHPIPSHPIT